MANGPFPARERQLWHENGVYSAHATLQPAKFRANLTVVNNAVDLELSGPLAQDSDHRIRWFGAFNSPLWEKEFRIQELPDNIKLVRIFVGIVVAAYMAFLWNAYRFLALSPMFEWMLALRGAVILISVAAVLMVRPSMSTRKFEWIVLAFTMAMKAIMLVIISTRPANFVGYTIVTVLSVLLTYWIVPLPLIWRAVSSWFLTLGVMIIGLWVDPWPDESTGIAITLGLILANVIGGEMCRQQQISKRKQFLALWLQQELSASLERAMGEIKTLRGILPICMHCKRIFDDFGKWEQIEEYIRKHSHAQFSHGLCPECARSQYPEIDWEDARRHRLIKANVDSKE